MGVPGTKSLEPLTSRNHPVSHAEKKAPAENNSNQQMAGGGQKLVAFTAGTDRFPSLPIICSSRRALKVGRGGKSLMPTCRTPTGFPQSHKRTLFAGLASRLSFQASASASATQVFPSSPCHWAKFSAQCQQRVLNTSQCRICENQPHERRQIGNFPCLRN